MLETLTPIFQWVGLICITLVMFGALPAFESGYKEYKKDNHQ